MQKVFIAGILTLLSTHVLAYGEAGQWSSGWGQGTTEYTAVIDANNNLYIACNDSQKVTMTVTYKGKAYGSDSQQPFSIEVDGTHYDTPYETESRVGENNFHDMWDKMRKAKSIVVLVDGKKMKLPTKEAATILPATNSKEFGCKMWDE